MIDAALTNVCSFQTYIQHNKDWNLIAYPSRYPPPPVFQTYIQHNKDWNTLLKRVIINRVSDFQTYIQHNKDWNRNYFH